MTSVLPSHLTLTGWANKATWPPQLCQILAAGALRCESALHFHQGLRIIFVHPRILQVGGVVAKWIALWGESLPWSCGRAAAGEYGPALAVLAEDLTTAQAHVSVYHAQPGIIANPAAVSTVIVTARD